MSEDIHTACRKALGRAWSTYLDTVLSERTEDGTLLIDLVLLINPELRERLTEAFTQSRATPPETRSDSDSLADEHARHIAKYRPQYDGKGGIAHVDHGGLWCACGEWDSGPRSGTRPWDEWHAHVVESLLMKQDAATSKTKMQTAAVWVDPGRRYGEPCVFGSRIPTSIVADAVWRFGVEEAVATWPHLSRAQVLGACWYESVYGKPKWKKRFGGWVDSWSVLMWSRKWDEVPVPPMKGGEHD